MPRLPTTPRLALLAEDQWGLLTRKQAELAGLAPASIARLVHRGGLERVAHGVYHLQGAPLPDHVELRAAWLQLAPEVLAWNRTAEQGIVSHRSAAALYGLGHLPADTHEFTLPSRRQTRRRDVRLHNLPIDDMWITLQGLPVTRPSRIAADLLTEREDPGAVAHIVAEATRAVFDYPGTFAESLAPFAARFGLRRGDGLALLQWFYGLVGDPDTDRWMAEARRSYNDARSSAELERQPVAT